MRRRLTVLLMLAVLPGTASAATRHRTETAQSGTVSSVLSYDKPRSYTYKNLSLAIARAGQQVYQAPVSTSFCLDCADILSPSGGGQTRSISARDLDGDGEPEVLLDLYTGGGHCCYVVQAFRYLPATGVYEKAEHTFYDFGYDLKDLDGDGRPEFVGADGRFDYVFAAFAASGAPRQIWQYRGGAFTDVTRRFPAAVRRDAAFWLQNYRLELHRSGAVAGFLAAWAADEFVVGRRAHAIAFVRWQIRHQPIRYTNKRTYVRRLLRFLRRKGYG